MIEVRLASILVNDQDKARDFYARVLGFVIKRDVPLGAANWLALVASDAPDGIELLLEPAGHPGSWSSSSAIRLRPHRSGHAAFPHPALPGSNPRYATRGVQG